MISFRHLLKAHGDGFVGRANPLGQFSNVHSSVGVIVQVGSLRKIL